MSRVATNINPVPTEVSKDKTEKENKVKTEPLINTGWQKGRPQGRPWGNENSYQLESVESLHYPLELNWSIDWICNGQSKFL